MSDPQDDDPPVAHKDAIRPVHKSLTTAKAFMTVALVRHPKALALLDGVMDALYPIRPQTRRTIPIRGKRPDRAARPH